MECLLSGNDKKNYSRNVVLILILMECLLRLKLVNKKKNQLTCLNPYSNGMLT